MQTIRDSTLTLEAFDSKMLEFPMATEIRHEFVVVLIDAFDNAALDKDRTNAGPSRYESCEVIDAQINQTRMILIQCVLCMQNPEITSVPLNFETVSYSKKSKLSLSTSS